MSKRSRSAWDVEMGGMDTARVLMLLAQHHQRYQRAGGGGEQVAAAAPLSMSGGRVFECKTCSRQFPTFQALGGHRASHKRPRLQHLQQQEQHHHANALGDGDDGAALCLGRRTVTPPPPRQAARPRAHECPVCGLEFAVGQALGGHMRRHRAEAEVAALGGKATPGGRAASCDGAGGICLDLNLTPSENCAKCRSVAGLGGAAGQGVHKALAMLDCSL